MKNDKIVFRIRQELVSMPFYQLDGRQISFACDQSDFVTIRESLVVWSGILLDIVDLASLFEKNESQKGRYKKLVMTAVPDIARCNLASSLTFLDNTFSTVINVVRFCPHTFKGCELIYDQIGRECLFTNCPNSLLELIRLLCREIFDSERADKWGDHGTSLRYLLLALRFLKKLPVSRLDLIDSMEEEYLENERRLELCDLGFDSPRAASWIAEINQLARYCFKDFDLKSLAPRHGPGRVAEDGVTSSFEKFLKMDYDNRLDYLLRTRDLGTMLEYAPWVSSNHSTRTAKFLAVPKTWKTLRGISAEPTELQYFQQAVLYGIDTYTQKNTFLSQRMDLHNQQVNQKLCKVGSIDQSLATIDLSKASDSVSVNLVKRLFKGTKLLPWLLGTRSTHVLLPSGLTIKIKKFAPMGSSTCFPVECLVFLLIAEVGRRRTQGALDRYKKISVPRVFGDDIVCDSTTVPHVLEGLELLGFLPNKTKSYWDGFYRESCGKEYWCGQDVSPLFFRAKVAQIDSPTITYESLSSLIGLQNSLSDFGFNTSRKYVIGIIMSKSIRLGRSSVRVSDSLVRTFDGSGGTIVSSQPTNFSLRIKFNRNLQSRLVSKVIWTRRYCRKDLDQIDGDLLNAISLHQWFLDKERTEPDYEETREKSSDLYSRTPIGYEMVPSVKKVPYWFYQEQVL